MLKALLVDLDGTLVDSEPANAAAYAAALSEHGIILDQQYLLRRIRGRSWREFLPELIGQRAGVEPYAVARRKQEIYPRLFQQIQLNSALLEMLAGLKGQLAIGLVTTASRRAGEAVLEHFRIGHLFDVTVFGEDVARAKPDPEAYALAASRLSVSARECLVFEDSDPGVDAARAFGAGVLRWIGGTVTRPGGAAVCPLY